MSVCLSVGPSVRMQKFDSHYNDFQAILHLSIFRKSVEKIQVPLNSEQNKYMQQTDLHFLSNLAELFWKREMVRTKVVQTIKTHILCSMTLLRKSYCLWGNVKKYGTAGQATRDNMAHAHCMPDTWGYRHTLRMCNNYCFCTATTDIPTRLSVTF
jgi:hypothetical protein